MIRKCLYCYKPINGEGEFHEACVVQFFGTKEIPEFPFSMKDMTSLAEKVVRRRISVPGVQPKLSMSLISDEDNANTYRLNIVDALDGHYIFKPPTSYYPELPANEHVTMRIADSYGLAVVPSTLVRMKSGELAYLTKRIDRTEEGGKIHMLDMYQITEAYDKYKSSMEKVGKALDAYSRNTLLDKVNFFELALFSFLIGNNDMHLKNFSMIRSVKGWHLAPAYDLLNATIANPSDNEELALTLAGKKSKFQKKHFDQLGKDLDLTLKQIDGAYNRMLKNKPKAIHWIQNSFLSNSMKEKYADLLERRYARLKE